MQSIQELEAAITARIEVNPKQAEALIRDLGNQRFIVIEFMKRTTGAFRKMVCRMGVKAHLKGGPPAYDASSKGLIVVWEPGKDGGYKAIPLESIVRLVVGHIEYSVTKEEEIP